VNQLVVVGSSLKLVLEEEEVTVEWIPSSDSDREGRRWPVTASRGRRLGAELTGATICTRWEMEQGSTPTPSCAGIRLQPMWVGSDRRRW
jgi:hypothetical protein